MGFLRKPMISLFFVWILILPNLASARTIDFEHGYNFFGAGTTVTEQQLQDAGCDLLGFGRGKDGRPWQSYNVSKLIFAIDPGRMSDKFDKVRYMTDVADKPWQAYLIFVQNESGCSIDVENEQPITELTLKNGYNAFALPAEWDGLTQAYMESQGCDLLSFGTGGFKWEAYSLENKVFTIDWGLHPDGIKEKFRRMVNVVEPYKAFLVYNDGAECTFDMCEGEECQQTSANTCNEACSEHDLGLGTCREDVAISDQGTQTDNYADDILWSTRFEDGFSDYFECGWGGSLAYEGDHFESSGSLPENPVCSELSVVQMEGKYWAKSHIIDPDCESDAWNSRTRAEASRWVMSDCTGRYDDAYDDLYYGIRIFLPSDFDSVYGDPNGDEFDIYGVSLVQLKEGNTWNGGLRYNIGRKKFDIIWNGETWETETTRTDIMKRGESFTFIMHSHATTDGKFEAWIDGEKVADYSGDFRVGPSSDGDKNRYIQSGLYTGLKQNEKEMYFTDVVVATSKEAVEGFLGVSVTYEDSCTAVETPIGQDGCNYRHTCCCGPNTDCQDLGGACKVQCSSDELPTLGGNLECSQGMQCCTPKGTTPTNSYPLRVVGDKILDSDDNEVYLAGFAMLESTHYLSYQTEKYSFLKQEGFNTIIIATGWDEWEPSQSQPGVYSQTEKNRIHGLLQTLCEQDLYVILAMRVSAAGSIEGNPYGWTTASLLLNEYSPDFDGYLNRFANTWEMVVNEYDDYDCLIGYDGWYYPYHGADPTSGWYIKDSMFDDYEKIVEPRLHQVIRENTDKIYFYTPVHQAAMTHPDVVSLFQRTPAGQLHESDPTCCSAMYDSDWDRDGYGYFRPLQDNNVVYCLEFHRPRNVEYMDGDVLTWTGTPAQKEHIDLMLLPAKEFSERYNVPMMVSEMGAITRSNSGGAQWRQDAYAYKMQVLNEYGIHWTHIWTKNNERITTTFDPPYELNGMGLVLKGGIK